MIVFKISIYLALEQKTILFVNLAARFFACTISIRFYNIYSFFLLFYAPMLFYQNFLLKTRFLTVVILAYLSQMAYSQNIKTTAGKVVKSTVSVKMLNPFIGSYIQGSAFSVGKGRFVTNYHVVALGKEGFIQKSAEDSTRIPIKRIVTFDVDNDLAIFEIDDIKVPALGIAETKLEVGDKVYVCGNPLGLTGTFSDGIVSANRTIEKRDVIQITAPVSSGSSGGPVVNENGSVIGVVFSTIMQGQNLNFVIPSKYLKKLLASPEFSYPLSWYNTTTISTPMKSIFSTKFDSKSELKYLKLKLSKNKNAIFSISKQTERQYIYNRASELSYKPDYMIYSRIKAKKECEACLYWGNLSNPNQNSAFFGIQNYFYGLCIQNNLVWVELLNKGAGTVKQEPLVLENSKNGVREYLIHKKGDSLYFSIDNQIVYKEAYLRMPGNHVGIGGHGPLEIEIEKLEVTQDQYQPNISSNNFSSSSELIFSNYSVDPLTEDETPFANATTNDLYFTRNKYSSTKMSREASIMMYKNGQKFEKNDFLSDNNGNYLFGLSPNSSLFYIEKGNPDAEFQTNHGLFVYNKFTGIKTDFPKIDEFYKFTSYSTYHLSPDAKYLVSSLLRFDSFGESDIYVFIKKDDGDYYAARNLGPQINGDKSEGTICMTPDNKYLFFTSSSHNGYGKKDLYVSKRLDSTWVRWSTPINLGTNVNTEEDEEDPKFNAITGELYYKTTTADNKVLFKKIKVPSEYINGYSIYDFSPNDKSSFEQMNVEITEIGKKNYTFKTMAETSKFAWPFENGKKYKVTAKAGAKTLFEKEIDLQNTTQFGKNEIKW